MDKNSRQWIFGGIRAWGVGMPFGWILTAFFLVLTEETTREGLVRVGRALKWWGELFLMISGVIALVIAFKQFYLREPQELENNKENK